MPALAATDFIARITWLGCVDRPESEGVRASPVQEIEARYRGDTRGRHWGETRPSCVRVKDMHPRGTDIRNVRQFSILSAEEVAAISEAMGGEELDPQWLGVSILIEGIPDFTHVPPSSRLQGEDGVTLVIDMENRPCQLPAREIEAARPGEGKTFLPAARGRRGVTAWVEREGRLRVGDALRLYIPDQRVWAPLDGVLSAEAKSW